MADGSGHRIIRVWGSSPARAWSKWTALATRRSMSSWRPARSFRAADSGLGDLDGVWGTPRGDGHENRALPPHRAGGGSAGVEIAQVVQRLGGQAVLVEGANRLIPREPAPLGEALSEALRGTGSICTWSPGRRCLVMGDDYVLRLSDGSEVRGERLLVSTARRPSGRGDRARDVGIEANPHGVRVDEIVVCEVSGHW